MAQEYEFTFQLMKKRTQMNKLLEAVKEASISVACLLDDVAVNNSSELDLTELKTDIENIQNQITIIENYLEPFVVAELDAMKEDA